MADIQNNMHDVPENWGGYSRMLGDLPLRSLPDGADGRLHARLTAGTASPRRSHRYARALALAASVAGVVAAVFVFNVEEPASVQTTAPSASINKEKPRRSGVRRTAPRPAATPHISTSSIPIDTNVPRNPIGPHRSADAVTGGDRPDAPHVNNAVPGVQRPRPETRSAP